MCTNDSLPEIKQNLPGTMSLNMIVLNYHNKNLNILLFEIFLSDSSHVAINMINIRNKIYIAIMLKMLV